MASVFKQQYTTKGKNGEKVKKRSAHWYIDYKGPDGTRKRVKGFKDKAATLQLAAKLEKESELAQQGLGDKFKEHRKRALSEHVDDFRASLIAKGNTEKHANQQKRRVKTTFDACGFDLWDDISASKIQNSISKMQKTARIVEKKKVNGKIVHTKKTKDLGLLSAKTQGYYLKAVKQFCRWMNQDLRASENPVEHLQPKKSTSVERTALDADQVRRLLETTQQAKTKYGMTGCERALLYRLAIETGFRVSELKSLRVKSFDLNSRIVSIEAGYAKNRYEAVLPLRQETAALLEKQLERKLPNGLPFKTPHKSNFAKMLRHDLKPTNVFEAEDLESIDFHCLRHTFGTMLAVSGVHPKVAQDLMRHSDINLTMSRYTHTLRGQTISAIDSLPDFGLPSTESNAARATGTDGGHRSESAYKKLTKKVDFSSTSMSSIDTKNGQKKQKGEVRKSSESGMLGNKKRQMSPSDVKRARQDSNLQPSDSKSGTLSN
jgi:integrase